MYKFRFAIVPQKLKRNKNIIKPEKKNKKSDINQNPI